MRLDAEEIEGRIRVSQANILGFAFSIGEERHEQLKGAPLPIDPIRIETILAVAAFFNIHIHYRLQKKILYDKKNT